MKIITFTKNSGAYSPGDRAGFDDALADTYIARGDALSTGEAPVSVQALPPADNTVKTGRKVRNAPEAA